MPDFCDEFLTYYSFFVLLLSYPKILITYENQELLPYEKTLKLCSNNNNPPPPPPPYYNWRPRIC